MFRPRYLIEKIFIFENEVKDLQTLKLPISPKVCLASFNTRASQDPRYFLGAFTPWTVNSKEKGLFQSHFHTAFFRCQSTQTLLTLCLVLYEDERQKLGLRQNLCLQETQRLLGRQTENTVKALTFSEKRFRKLQEHKGELLRSATPCPGLHHRAPFLLQMGFLFHLTNSCINSLESRASFLHSSHPSTKHSVNNSPNHQFCPDCCLPVKMMLQATSTTWHSSIRTRQKRVPPATFLAQTKWNR